MQKEKPRKAPKIDTSLESIGSWHIPSQGAEIDIGTITKP